MTHACKHDAETLKQLQALPLRAKVFESRQRIAEWVEHWGEDKVYVAFSGGLDSLVTLNIVRKDYPGVPGVFCDTGLEFPEIRDFVKTIDNVTWIKPKMTFKQVVTRYGYPLVSKEQAQFLHEYREFTSEKILDIRWNGNNCGRGKISEKWKFLASAPFKVSHKCCDVMKKDPSKRYEKETGRKPILGTTTGESELRKQQYLKYGCNSFDAKRTISKPLSFWGKADVWEYIHANNLEYCCIYDRGEERTGCMMCGFGVHKDNPNRFQRMQKSHPSHWRHCMNHLGMREVLQYCHIPIEDKQLYFDFGEETDNGETP